MALHIAKTTGIISIGMRLFGAAVLATTLWIRPFGAELFWRCMSCFGVERFWRFAILALALICLITIVHQSLSLVFSI